MIQACAIGLRNVVQLRMYCSALVLFCEPYDQGQVRKMSAQPDQINVLKRLSFDCLTIRQCIGISAEKIPFVTRVK